MTNLQDGHTLVLAGHGCDEGGPYLSLNDVEARAKVRFAVRGKTFTLRRLARRLCTGRFDLQTNESVVCPLDVELLPGSKETACPACLEATGFNPSFYYALTVSPQQRAYNEQPHYTYLAYFAPGFVKAGISSEGRGVRRLLDQGARAARVVGRFKNAYAARELEAALCMQEGICETMRLSKKADLLAHARFDFGEACRALDEAVASVDVAGCFGTASDAPTELDAAMERLGRGEGKAYFDFTSAYFGDEAVPMCDEMQLADASADVCAGRCVGMVGSILVLEQQGMHFLAPLKDWESHVVELHEGEVLHEYAVAPVQMSLL